MRGAGVGTRGRAAPSTPGVDSAGRAEGEWQQPVAPEPAPEAGCRAAHWPRSSQAPP